MQRWTRLKNYAHIEVVIAFFVIMFLFFGHDQGTTIMDFDENWWKSFLQASRSFLKPWGAKKKQNNQNYRGFNFEIRKDVNEYFHLNFLDLDSRF